MTLRISVILWMVLLVLGVFGLYMVKYKVRAIKSEVAAAERQLIEEKRNLHVLNAEWTYLNQPARLRALSAKYLDVKPIRGQQIADFVSLPYTKSSNLANKQDAHSTGAVKLVSGGGGSASEEDLSDE